jgi:protein-tyrosine phosphatase
VFNLFKKKKIENPGFTELKADMHSHLLPGIDDGSPDMATSIALVKGMVELGYSKLITTPHVLSDMYPNSSAIIQEKLEELRQAVKDEGIVVELNAAAEYFLDEQVAQMIKKKEPLLPVSGNMILVEFSMAYPSHGLKDILFEMQMQGYVPIIAHPERYIYLQQNKEFYEELKDIGCLFQLNILSFTPQYGRSVQELASYLLKKDHYDLVGTDLHHRGHLEALRSPALINPLRKLLDTGRIKNAQL